MENLIAWDKWCKEHPARKVDRLPICIDLHKAFDDQSSAECYSEEVNDSELYGIGLEVVEFENKFYVIKKL